MRYFFNRATRESVWWSSSLPHGWGKLVSPDQKVTFVGLLSGTRTATPPAAADSAQASKRPRSPDPATALSGKRARAPAADTPRASPSAASLSEASEAARPAVATVHPRLSESWTAARFPDEHPGAAVAAIARAAEAAEAADPDGPLFRDEHRLVLAQLIDAACVSAKQSGSARVTVLDIGAGLGRATAFAAKRIRAAGLHPTVVAVDSWHAPFAGAILNEHGHPGLAKALWGMCEEPEAGRRRLVAGPRHLDAFAETVWEARSDVIVRRGLVPRVLPRLRGDGIEPDVVFIDAELHRTRVRRLIRTVIELFPAAAVCGGGWNLSQGVREGVTDVVRGIRVAQRAASAAAAGPAAADASEPDSAAGAAAATAGSVTDTPAHPIPRIPVSLHVECGAAWTLAGTAIKRSRNKDSGAVLASSRVASGAVTAAESEQAWVGGLVQLLERGDDGAEVWRRCKGRGRPVAAARAAWASTEGGPLPGEDPKAVWVDSPQTGSKRQLTALAVAAKNGRRDAVRALLAAGARVNVQAAKNRGAYYALQLSAFEGHEHVVRLLLRAGARGDLQTKWRETADRVAKKPAVKAMLGAVAALPPGAPATQLLDAVGRATADDPEEMRRDDMALDGRYEPPRAGP